jgi:hypothetical protein
LLSTINIILAVFRISGDRSTRDASQRKRSGLDNFFPGMTILGYIELTKRWSMTQCRKVKSPGDRLFLRT